MKYTWHIAWIVFVGFCLNEKKQQANNDCVHHIAGRWLKLTKDNNRRPYTVIIQTSKHHACSLAFTYSSFLCYLYFYLFIYQVHRKQCSVAVHQLITPCEYKMNMHLKYYCFSSACKLCRKGHAGVMRHGLPTS